tara:strand:+ start:65 stop:424 length:360 start_codon:yes stop_codon:yes gene_type:complete
MAHSNWTATPVDVDDLENALDMLEQVQELLRPTANRDEAFRYAVMPDLEGAESGPYGCNDHFLVDVIRTKLNELKSPPCEICGENITGPGEEGLGEDTGTGMAHLVCIAADNDAAMGVN